MDRKITVCIARSNPVAPDPRVEKIARSLHQEGYQVAIIAWDRSAQLPAETLDPAYSIRRLAIQAAYGNGLGNLPALLRWQAGLLMWLARHRGEFDVIHACDFDTILAALACKILWGKRVVYDIFDFYADHLRRTPALLKKLIRRVDTWAIGQADGVILVDDSRRQQIAGSEPKRLIAVYNSPEDRRELYKHLAPDPDRSGLRIAYVGLLQVERGIFEMIHVLANHPDWHLDLAGFGGDEAAILDQIRDMPNITWHGRVDYDRALQISAAADVLFATYDPRIENHRYSSANKVFEGMMLGKPVIAARGTNMDQLILDANCGLVVNYGVESELDSALSLLACDPGLRLEKGENARSAYERIYRWENMQLRLKRLYREVLGQPDQVT